MAHEIEGFEQYFIELPQIKSVDNTQDREYLLTAHSEKELPAVEIALIELFAKKDWQYKQIINGKTLENQLFN